MSARSLGQNKSSFPGTQTTPLLICAISFTCLSPGNETSGRPGRLAAVAPFEMAHDKKLAARKPRTCGTVIVLTPRFFPGQVTDELDKRQFKGQAILQSQSSITMNRLDRDVSSDQSQPGDQKGQHHWPIAILASATSSPATLLTLAPRIVTFPSRWDF